MNAIKTLLAVSALAAAGGAQAAIIATYDYSLSGTVADVRSDSVSGSDTGSGTATLDDSGMLTLNGSRVATAYIGSFLAAATNTTVTTTFNGTYAGGAFTATSGQIVPNSCFAGCDRIFNMPVGYDSVSGTVLLSGGSINAVVVMNGFLLITDTWTLTPTTPAVPVPAAAWLFGSGLLGLAGITRRRAA